MMLVVERAFDGTFVGVDLAHGNLTKGPVCSVRAWKVLS